LPFCHRNALSGGAGAADQDLAAAVDVDGLAGAEVGELAVRPYRRVRHARGVLAVADHQPRVVLRERCGVAAEAGQCGRLAVVPDRGKGPAAGGVAGADDLPAVVDRGRAAVAARGAQVGQPAVAPHERVQGPIAGLRLADHVAALVDAADFGVGAAGQQAQVGELAGVPDESVSLLAHTEVAGHVAVVVDRERLAVRRADLDAGDRGRGVRRGRGGGRRGRSDGHERRRSGDE
jgi:hypothetical protein